MSEVVATCNCPIADLGTPELVQLGKELLVEVLIHDLETGSTQDNAENAESSDARINDLTKPYKNSRGELNSTGHMVLHAVFACQQRVYNGQCPDEPSDLW